MRINCYLGLLVLTNFLATRAEAQFQFKLPELGAQEIYESLIHVDRLWSSTEFEGGNKVIDRQLSKRAGMEWLCAWIAQSDLEQIKKGLTAFVLGHEKAGLRPPSSTIPGPREFPIVGNGFKGHTVSVVTAIIANTPLRHCEVQGNQLQVWPPLDHDEQINPNPRAYRSASGRIIIDGYPARLNTNIPVEDSYLYDLDDALTKYGRRFSRTTGDSKTTGLYAMEGVLDLIDKCPSFEYLCRLSLPKELQEAEKLIGVMPRPLSECDRSVVYSTMKELLSIPDSALEQLVKLVDQLFALSKEFRVSQAFQGQRLQEIQKRLLSLPNLTDKEFANLCAIVEAKCEKAIPKNPTDLKRAFYQSTGMVNLIYLYLSRFFKLEEAGYTRSGAIIAVDDPETHMRTPWKLDASGRIIALLPFMATGPWAPSQITECWAQAKRVGRRTVSSLQIPRVERSR